MARSAPDGYTLLSSASSSFVIGPHVYKLAFDVVKDIAPVAPMALTPMYLVVRSDSPAKTVAELVALARANPGKLNYGSAGNGTLPHVAGEMLAAHRGRPGGRTCRSRARARRSPRCSGSRSISCSTRAWRSRR